MVARLASASTALEVARVELEEAQVERARALSRADSLEEEVQNLRGRGGSRARRDGASANGATNEAAPRRAGSSQQEGLTKVLASLVGMALAFLVACGFDLRLVAVASSISNGILTLAWDLVSWLGVQGPILRSFDLAVALAFFALALSLYYRRR